MKRKTKIVSKTLALALLLSISSSTTSAQMSATHQMSATQTNQFKRIEQPLGLKVGLTLGGLALIGLDLWWFVISKNSAKKAEISE